MFKKLLTMIAIIGIVTIPSNSSANMVIRKPITCVQDFIWDDFAKALHLKLLIVSNTENITKMVYINPKNNDLLLVHRVKQEQVVCLIDDMVNPQTELELLPSKDRIWYDNI